MSARAGERRVLDEAGGLGAMTGVMAIMLFLTLLAAAAGLATAGAARLLDRQLAGRLTVQVASGETGRRDAVAAEALAALRRMPGVARATRVDGAALARLLRPWLGEDGDDPELPIPAMIDVDLSDGAPATAARVIARVGRIGRDVRVERHADFMAPVSGLLDATVLLATGIVALMLAATAAVVVLAARAGLEAHRATIGVMHLLGSTDRQIARLFQRRIGIDATIGGAAGAGGALAVIAAIGARLGGAGSELLAGITLSAGDWAVLAFVPVGFVAVAVAAARITVLRSLGRLS